MLTSEQLREIEEKVASFESFIAKQREFFKHEAWWRDDALGIQATEFARLLLSEVRRIRHETGECECMTLVTPHVLCPFAEDGPHLPVAAGGG